MKDKLRELAEKYADPHCSGGPGPLFIAGMNAAYRAASNDIKAILDAEGDGAEALRSLLSERQAAMQGQGGEVVIPSASANCPICGVDSPHGHNMKDRWIGVDLDNTLATDAIDRHDPYTIGEPIYPMVHRVMNLVARGYEVRIFTARMCEYSYTSKQHRNVGRMQEAIGDWCLTHIGTRLEATNQKDGAMEVLWDDRAVRVLPDQGAPSFLFERSIQPPQPVRSVSDEDVELACCKYYNCGHPVYPPVFEGMRAALEHFAAIAQEKQS
jgi:hypothetical protein